MFPTPSDTMVALAVRYQGDWAQTYSAMHHHEELTDEEVIDLLSTVRSKTVTILDDDYPAFLRDGCIRPPLVLFYYGDLSLIQNVDRILTVVGARAPSTYAIGKTREICREMVVKDYILCSGLAYGIDTIAAEEGSAKPGHSIAVLGCGIDRMYPLENTPLRDKIASTGLLLSEYPNDVTPDSKHFPLRNRILAGLSKAVFASEVHFHSGTSITVSFALQMDRDVGMLPFPAGEEVANNLFLKSGAAIIESADDLDLLMQGRTRFRGNFL